MLVPRTKILQLWYLLSLVSFQIYATPPSLDDFLLEPTLRDVALSPNGRYLAEVWNKQDLRFITIKDLSLPKRPVIAKLGDNIVRANAIAWANNERLLVHLIVPHRTDNVRTRSQDNENFDIDDYTLFSRTVAMDIDGKNLVELMEGQRAFRKSVALSEIQNYLPQDPQHILLNSYRNGKKALYKVNVYNGEAELIIRGSGRTYRFITNVIGEPKYRIDFWRWTKKVYIFKLLENNEWEKIETLYLDKNDEDSIDLEGLIGLYEDDLIYRKRNEETGFYQLVALNRKTDENRVLASLPNQDVKSLVLRRRTKEIIGYSVEIDNNRFTYFDAKNQTFYDEIASYLEGYNFYVYNYNQVSEKALVSFWGPDNPNAYALYDRKLKQMTLLDYAYPELSVEKMSIPALSHYKTRDGVKIRNYILLPTNYKKGLKLPMVVLPHGGPQSRSRSSYDDFAQFVSTRGYIVIKPNFRGSTGYGRDFEEAGYKQWGQLMQDDITDAVAFMVAQGFADPKKVCIAGFSYGGYAALMGAIKTPNLYQCAVSINGVTHLRDQIDFDIDVADDDQEFIQKYILNRIGDPKTDSIMLDLNSPALQVDKLNIPLLIMAGEKDRIVPYEQAETLIEALEKHNKIHEFIEFDDAGHDLLNNEENIERVYKSVAAFLDEHLGV